jgi:3-oxoacyl-[acyl-carrier protein] reductase
MDLQLKEKRALVTGASRGLGYATALALLGEGCRVAINSRDEERLKTAAGRLRQATGGEAFSVAADLGVAGSAEQLVSEAALVLGGLDILVCSAGGPPPGAFESFDDTAWQKAIDLSFMSNVRLIRAALPFLRKSAAPSVLTVTSYSVKQPIPNLILSNSVRLATIGLTKSLAIELGAEGIRFNAILPGWTETERVAQLMAARAQAAGTSASQEQAAQAREIPLGRMGKPDEFARAAVFLVSPAASYITGVMLQVDGGTVKGTF